MWIMGAYRSLPRPFRKHVQHIVLVRPSGGWRLGGSGCPAPPASTCNTSCLCGPWVGGAWVEAGEWKHTWLCPGGPDGLPPSPAAAHLRTSPAYPPALLLTMPTPTPLHPRKPAFLRTVLAFMRPFVSRKAHRKIKQVQSVHDIATATDGEVTLQSLGPAFVAEQLAAEEAAAAAAAAAGAGSAGGSAGNASP